MKRWHYRLENDKEVEAEWKEIENLSRIPENVRALPISDFDPLPPEMPIIASIVEAWHQLAMEYDKETSLPEDCDDARSLMDRWHGLFQVAAAGWSLKSRAPGLMDQVLDQQEKVKNWKLLDQQWREFVEEVLKRGKCLKTPHQLPLDVTFVLIIDDVDLQVARIRELLPAIRLLSRHHSVWFLVAGDSKHMLDMLRADFLGQQLKLAGKDVSDPLYWMDKPAKWADTLARASFQKVFGLRNQFRVKRLSTKKFLQYPKHTPESMRTILNELKAQSSDGEQSTVTKATFGNLGDYLSTFLDDPEVLPEFMPYRLAHQIFEQAERSRGGERALEAVQQMIGVYDTDDSVTIVERDDHPQIVYRAVGTLSALSSRGFAEPLDNDSEVTLSGQARFAYRTGALQGGCPARC